MSRASAGTLKGPRATQKHGDRTLLGALSRASPTAKELKPFRIAKRQLVIDREDLVRCVRDKLEESRLQAMESPCGSAERITLGKTTAHPWSLPPCLTLHYPDRSASKSTSIRPSLNTLPPQDSLFSGLSVTNQRPGCSGQT